MVEVKKRYKGYNDGFVKFEILWGLYKLREILVLKLSLKCKGIVKVK